MKNGIKIKKIDYIVNSEEKIVVCLMKCEIRWDNGSPYVYIAPYMWQKSLPHINRAGEFTVKAIARCNNLDTFDEKTGKRIAESRAKKKVFSTAAKFYLKLGEFYLKYITITSNVAKACLQAEEVEDSHIQALLK